MFRKILPLLFLIFFSGTVSAKDENANSLTSNTIYGEILFLVKFSDNSRFEDGQVLKVLLYDADQIDSPPIATFEDVNFGDRGLITGRLNFEIAEFEKISRPAYNAHLEKDGQIIAVSSSNQLHKVNRLAQEIIIDRVK